MRIEKDFLGEKQIEKNIYYGIHTARALENFDLKYKKTNVEIIKAMVLVKMAAARANNKTGKLSNEKLKFINEACQEIYDGKYDNQFNISALQGGAGTSVNMNVNEVIANIVLEKLREEKGSYNVVNPIEDINMSQSTNDVYPTAVKTAVIKLLRELVDNVMELQMELQAKENEFADVFKLGRTQLRDAVPITLGQEFGAYAEAVSRDRWRLYKAEERIRQINIGGTAIGTGVGASPKYRFEVSEELRRITGFGLARAENLIDNTQNLDIFVEISGLLKTLAVNLKKIANDLRLMNSGPKSGLNEIELPSIQSGSSIMPAKINPVGAELMMQAYYKVVGNDMSITMACADGEFELNAMMPLVADLIIENIEILRDSVKIFSEKVIKGIKVNREVCLKYLKESSQTITLLIDELGYEKLTEILKESMRTGKNYKEIIIEKELMSKEKISSFTF